MAVGYRLREVHQVMHHLWNHQQTLRACQVFPPSSPPTLSAAPSQMPSSAPVEEVSIDIDELDSTAFALGTKAKGES